MNIDELLTDLAPFSDLGDDPPTGTKIGDTAIIQIVRNGQGTTLHIAEGSVCEIVGDESKRYRNLAALLSSPNYADMVKWADRQKVALNSIVKRETIEILANDENHAEANAVKLIDDLLTESRSNNRRNCVIVVDGPAGIGKTSVVRKLSRDRACRYAVSRLPIILHIESRGRVLQNISDLMAFSLQSLRLSVTYDQVPTLVKYGLVTLAIDGFDELGDPNGYDLAWAQLDDLIASTHGNGSFVLSGRETFISGARIRKALNSISDDHDTIATVTVNPIAPTVARAWLRENGWTDEQLESRNAEPLFERGSYALRPFFLSQLAKLEVANDIASAIVEDTLSFLINSMLHREQDKFGRDVNAITTVENRKKFVSDLMEEVARDIADNQTDAISAETLAWLSDVTAADLPPGVHGILRNRVDVIAFLTVDERRGYRKFIHEEVGNFFLAKAAIKAIIRNDIPKFIRRNILGLDFLESFSDVVRLETGEVVDRFLVSARQMLDTISDQDRGKGNIAALVLAACSVSENREPVIISDVSIDEAFLSDTVSPTVLNRVTITQLDVRNTDLRAIEFNECVVVTVIANSGTFPSQTIPKPSVLALPATTITKSSEIEAWFAGQYWQVEEYPLDVSLHNIAMKYPIFQLLARLVRYKPFWLKNGEEKAARRILDDPHWGVLRELLLKHDLLVERTDVPSSGRPASFYHLKNKEALSNLDTLAENLRPLFRDMVDFVLGRSIGN